AGVQPGPAAPGPVLPRVRAADGALGEGAAAAGLRAALRGVDGRPGGGQPAAGRLLRPGVGRALPPLPRDPAPRADGQDVAGGPADVPQRRRPLEALRGPPGAAARSAGGTNHRLAASVPRALWPERSRLNGG